MKISYGKTEPCAKCGELNNLSASHSFGAKIVCPCGNEGKFVPGNNYQDEEFWAVYQWNKEQKEAQAANAPGKPTAANEPNEG